MVLPNSPEICRETQGSVAAPAIQRLDIHLQTSAA